MIHKTDIQPCPFCGIMITSPNDAGYYVHASKDCFLGDYEIEPAGIDEWNRRSAPASQSAEVPVAWMLEWTYDGEERGQRLYDDERHCLIDAQKDGGVCVPLIRAAAPAPAYAPAAPPTPIGAVRYSPDDGDYVIDWDGEPPKTGTRLYAGPVINQCDGCNVGAPLAELGNHAMPNGGFMGCTKCRYVDPGAAPCQESSWMSGAAADAKPIGYLPKCEVDRLESGHDARLRSAKLGPSYLDGDIAVYLAPTGQQALSGPDARRPWDGDSEESRAAFRTYDAHEAASTRSAWQIWRDACAWQAHEAASHNAVAQPQSDRELSDLEWTDVFERISLTIPNIFGSYAKVRGAFAREAIRIAQEQAKSSEPKGMTDDQIAESAQAWLATREPCDIYQFRRDELVAFARAILAASPVEQPVAAPIDEPFAIAYQLDNRPSDGYFIYRWTANLQWCVQNERTDVRNLTALYAGPLPDMDGYLDSFGNPRADWKPTTAPAPAPALAPADERGAIACQAHSGPDCIECGGTGVWPAPDTETLTHALFEYEGALQSEDEDEIAPARSAFLNLLRPIWKHLEAPPLTLTPAERDVIAERRRQVAGEGWTDTHDDAHYPGELAAAAHAYIGDARIKLAGMGAPNIPPIWWPWDLKWWKPGTARRNLEKAVALLIAEIERIDRATKKEKP